MIKNSLYNRTHAGAALLQGLLLSGSDDMTARVWDTVSGQLVVLQGHRDHVRGLVWHTEVPYLVITGG